MGRKPRGKSQPLRARWLLRVDPPRRAGQGQVVLKPQAFVPIWTPPGT